MSTFLQYARLVRAWLTANLGLSFPQAVDYALRTLEGIAHINPAGIEGMLILHILEGLIVGNNQVPAVTGADGTPYQAGPVVTPEHAVAAAQAALSHVVTGAASLPGNASPDGTVPL